MEQFRLLAAIFVFAFGTLGSTDCICTDLCCNDVKGKAAKIENRTRANVLRSAKRWLGVRELTGYNDHPMITKSMQLCGLTGNKGYPWCASSHSEIFAYAGLNTTVSARVMSWFKANVIWERKWGTGIPKRYVRAGMSVGFYYNKLNRYGHIGLAVYKTGKYIYLYEGNTSSKGQFDPETFENVEEIGTGVNRDGDGFYPKVRQWQSIDVIADKCLQGKRFIERYDEYLQKVKK